MAKRVEMKGRDGSIRMVLTEINGVLLPPVVQDPEKALADFRAYPYQDGDILICSYPKTGTNWLLDLVNMVRIGSTDVVMDMTPPLELMPQLSARKPAPRTLMSHMPYRLLPSEFLQKGRKIILMCRNPKDTAVSTYNHAKNDKTINYQGDWDEFADFFIDGTMIFGGYLQYYLDWDQVIRKKPDVDILPVRYENFKLDCVGELRKICDFLGLQRDDDYLKLVEDKNNISKVKAAKEASEATKPLMQFVSKDGRSLPFYRKGVVGDWKNYFSPEQEAKFDKVIGEALKDTIFNYK